MLGCEVFQKGVNTMIAVAERPTAAVLSENLPPPAGTQARAVALAYLQYASACWRGDSHAPVFETRLGAFWRPDLTPAPTTAPDAVSPHGGGGHGVRWHEIGGDVLGHVPGARGGYQIPGSAIPRLVKCASRVPPAGGLDGRDSRSGDVA
jgi:hypothetical protein